MAKKTEAVNKKMLRALCGLAWILQDGSHYASQNPYTRPEVERALKAIADATGYKGDWRSANDNWLREKRRLKL
jgi:hypothetical protein